MRHMYKRENVALVSSRQTRDSWAVFASETIIGHKSVSAFDINAIFPLYLYPNGNLPEEDLFAHENDRRPNLSAEFTRDFCEKLKVKFVPEGLGRPGKHEIGPESIFYYAYAVFHSPAYRELYVEFLRADFPRLPLTTNYELFRALADFGGELTLSCPDLPPGVTMHCENMAANLDVVPVVFEAAEDAEPSGRLCNLTAKPADPKVPVQLPGDPERRERERRLAGGIPLDEGTWGQLRELAEQLGVPVP